MSDHILPTAKLRREFMSLASSHLVESMINALNLPVTSKIFGEIEKDSYKDTGKDIG